MTRIEQYSSLTATMEAAANEKATAMVAALKQQRDAVAEAMTDDEFAWVMGSTSPARAARLQSAGLLSGDPYSAAREAIARWNALPATLPPRPSSAAADAARPVWLEWVTGDPVAEDIRDIPMWQTTEGGTYVATDEGHTLVGAGTRTEWLRNARVRLAKSHSVCPRCGNVGCEAESLVVVEYYCDGRWVTREAEPVAPEGAPATCAPCTQRAQAVAAEYEAAYSEWRALCDTQREPGSELDANDPTVLGWVDRYLGGGRTLRETIQEAAQQIAWERE